MAIYCVTYDLNSPGQGYKALHSHLQQYTYCKHLESVYLIDSIKSAEQIRDELHQFVDKNDVLFVAQLGGAWGSLNYQCADWLNDPLRRW